MKNYLLLAVLMSVFVVSCEKDDINEDDILEKAEINVQGIEDGEIKDENI